MLISVLENDSGSDYDPSQSNFESNLDANVSHDDYICYYDNNDVNEMLLGKVAQLSNATKEKSRHSFKKKKMVINPCCR